MSAATSETLHRNTAPRPRNRWLRLALRAMEIIRVGTVTVELPGGMRHTVRRTDYPSATVVVKDLRAARRLILGGSLGLAEAYVEGWWDSPDILAVMEVAAANEAEWQKMLMGSRLTRFASRLAHGLRRNSRKGARRNIIEHYDLGNAFYAAWLDPSMTYSSALFADGAVGLEAAQMAKIHHLCRMLDLRPGLRLLEIGCGWGAFAEVAARDYG